MQWAGQQAHEHYRAVVASAPATLVALDYDGTLAPIVEDPTQALMHPAMPGLIRRLSDTIHTVAIVTGRPVAQLLDLADMTALAKHCPHLVVLGQYGNETWSAREQQVTSAAAPSGLEGFMRDLPATLAGIGIDPLIEEKGLAVGIHTRGLPDPVAAYERLVTPVTALAARHGLGIEPGRLVLEARAMGMDKGVALRDLIDATHVRGVIYVGDDLGDLPAFVELSDQRARGRAALTVCSESSEEQRLSDQADIVVPGPDGVALFLDRFLRDVQSSK